MKRRTNRTSIAMGRHCTWAEATGRVVIALQAEIAAGVVEGPVAAVVIGDAAGAVDVPAVAGAIVAAAADRAAEDTRNLLPRICTNQHE